MTDDLKRKSLAFLLLAAVATILLAAALPQLTLKPGIPLPDWGNEAGTLATDELRGVTISVNTLFKAIVVVIVGLVLAYVAYRFLRGRSWKEIFKESAEPILMIVVLALIVLAIIFILTRVHVTAQPVETETLPPSIKVNGPPLGLPPTNLIWLVWIGLAVVVALLAIWIIHWKTSQARAGDPLGLEAERAVQALRTGLDLRNVILRCYEQMSLALQKEQGVQREETMTAREFERLLEARGIPNAPVHQLTQLFELARYGDRPLGVGDEQKALDCLDAIVQYCDERKPAE